MSERKEINPEDFQYKKTKYFSDFAMRHLSAFRIHKEHGLLPKKEGWRNVSEHCLVEAVAADCLAEGLQISVENRQKLVMGAMLHDFFKRREIELMNVRGKRSADIAKEAEDKGTEYLNLKKIDPEIIRIINSPGVPSLDYFETQDPTTEEKVMRYVDDITDGNDLVFLKGRMERVAKRYPDIEKNIFERIFKVSEKIESEIADKLGLADARELPMYIKRKIEERIKS